MPNNDHSRRDFFRHACCGSLGIASSLSFGVAHAADGKKTSLSAEQALAVLKKGNADFCSTGPASGRISVPVDALR